MKETNYYDNLANNYVVPDDEFNAEAYEQVHKDFYESYTKELDELYADKAPQEERE